jgi:small subunit ribosomal protein S20
MPNTMSAKKAVRQSKNKEEHNLFWKRRIYSIKKAITKTLQTKDVNADILNNEYKALQKVVDKAAKEKVIHKNKASRIKARFAKKIAAHDNARTQAKKESK